MKCHYQYWDGERMVQCRNEGYTVELRKPVYDPYRKSKYGVPVSTKYKEPVLCMEHFLFMQDAFLPLEVSTSEHYYGGLNTDLRERFGVSRFPDTQEHIREAYEWNP